MLKHRLLGILAIFIHFCYKASISFTDRRHYNLLFGTSRLHFILLKMVINLLMKSILLIFSNCIYLFILFL